ncbi:MAG: RecQ family ATP-dependent DNA helicase, partial [Christensenellales bacterium]|nr:RecQ family ATP-dependent DNA helicase [Christensenellales bacterium]
MEFPKRGNYRHFKGNMYELIDFARHSETQEWMVIYRALYGDWGIWVRPLSMWNETVERDGKLVPRFALIPDGEETTVPETEFSDEHVPEREGNAFDSESTDEKHKVLKQYFGYDLFREGQELAIDSILSGKDTLAVMPTGAGKSVCYQIPALMSSGISIVISPLISLMKDQVQTLSGNGIPAAYLNSSLTEKQFDLAVENVLKGKYKILYVAPERLLTRRFLSAISHANITLVAVDEAHCISQWGQDFRPSYLTIPEFLECLNRRPVVCAFTATATHQVREDIQTLLGMCKPEVIVTGFDRTNLYYSVCEPSSKDDQVLRLAKMYRGFSGIVYCATRKNVEKVFELLLSRGFSVTRYHAGLTDAERRTNQEDFSYDRKEIMVATNAFGMGIDKSDVRFIIHYNMPKDLESYYQEAGRAGRDGERADCHLLFAKQDIITQNFFIDHMG